ncbi:unnamed protein product, partial [Rotaria sp. Silwood2]
TDEPMMEFIKYYHDKMIYCIQKIIERTLLTYIDLVSITETKYLIDQTKLIRFLFEGKDINEQSIVDTQRIRISCTIQCAIPEIIIDPQLSLCQKCICDVAQAIINCDKIISGKNICERT